MGPVWDSCAITLVVKNVLKLPVLWTSMNQLTGNELYAGEINDSSWVPVPWTRYGEGCRGSASSEKTPPHCRRECSGPAGLMHRPNVKVALDHLRNSSGSVRLWFKVKIVNYIEHMYIVLIPMNEFSGRWCSQWLFFQSSSSCTFIGWLKNHRVS